MKERTGSNTEISVYALCSPVVSPFPDHTGQATGMSKGQSACAISDADLQ